MKCKFKGEKLNSILQFISYASVGASNVIIDIIVLNILWKITGKCTGNVNYLFKFISFLIYSTTGYLLNKHVTFKSNGGIKAYFKYVALLAVLSAIDAIIIVHLTLIPIDIPITFWSNICALLASMTTGILGFLINKFLIFSKKNNI